MRRWADRPGENLISEMMSLRWWKDTRSSRVSAFTIMKLPSFRPTAKALPSGEKQQQRPPAADKVSVKCLGRSTSCYQLAFQQWLTFPEFAYSQHAVARGQVPYAQGFVIADGSTEREMGMSGQAPHFTLHVTLPIHKSRNIWFKWSTHFYNRWWRKKSWKMIQHEYICILFVSDFVFFIPCFCVDLIYFSLCVFLILKAHLIHLFCLTSLLRIPSELFSTDLIKLDFS